MRLPGNAHQGPYTACQRLGNCSPRNSTPWPGAQGEATCERQSSPHHADHATVAAESHSLGVPTTPLHLLWGGGGVEEDASRMRTKCERDAEVARSPCATVEEFTADLPLADRAMQLMSRREHGIRWTVSLMAGHSSAEPDNERFAIACSVLTFNCCSSVAVACIVHVHTYSVSFCFISTIPICVCMPTFVCKIMHHTLRNSATGSICLQSVAKESILQSFACFHPE